MTKTEIAGIWEVSADGASLVQLVKFDHPSMPTGRAEFALDESHFYFTVAKQQNDVFTLEVELQGEE